VLNHTAPYSLGRITASRARAVPVREHVCPVFEGRPDWSVAALLRREWPATPFLPCNKPDAFGGHADMPPAFAAEMIKSFILGPTVAPPIMASRCSWKSKS
jgi:hypothetical protein